MKLFKRYPVVCLLLLFVAFLPSSWFLIRFLLEPNSVINDSNSLVVDAWIKVVGGAIAFFGLSVAWRRAESTNRQTFVAIEQIKISQKNTEVLESEKASIKFSESVKMISSDKDCEVIGGLYMLEHIALNHPDFYRGVVEVISSFIKQKLRYPAEHWNRDVDKLKEDVLAPYEIGDLPPSQDSKIALDIIGRINKYENDFYIDLSEICIKNIKLNNLNYHNISFENSVFVQTIFENVDFSNSKVDVALIVLTDFNQCNLTDMSLRSTKITGMKTEGCIGLPISTEDTEVFERKDGRLRLSFADAFKYMRKTKDPPANKGIKEKKIEKPKGGIIVGPSRPHE